MFSPAAIGAGDVRTFLVEHLGPDIGSFEIVGEGAWSRCYGFGHRDRKFVIRVGRFVEDFEKDRRAAGFSSQALPIPDVTEIGAANGCFFAISSRAYGAPLESVGSQVWETVMPALFAALDAARSVDLSDTTGYGVWDGHGVAGRQSWPDFLLAVDDDTPDRRTYGWRQRLIDSPLGDGPFRTGVAKLAELVNSCPTERHLVHGDLLNGNVLVEPGRINAVFDWGCSCYGDFLYDIAWLEFWAPWHPSIAATDIRTEARRHYTSIGLDVEDLDARLRCYLIHIGLDHQAYTAYTGRRDDLMTITERTLSFVE